MRRYTTLDMICALACGFLLGLVALTLAQEQVRDGLDRIHATHVEVPVE